MQLTASDTLTSVVDKVRHASVTGKGFAVTAITGSIGGASISEYGTGGKVQTLTVNFDTDTFDNTIFNNTANGGGGSSFGLDIYGLEFTAGDTHYNLYQQGGQFYVADLNTGAIVNLTLDSTDAPCFCAGTLISTPEGECNVEDLKAGDMVLTAAGEKAKPVRWIGRRAVSTRFADPQTSMPVRIEAGALGNELPKRDLLVSPDHAMFLDGILVQAGAMLNGTSIVREEAMPSELIYYHIETSVHDLTAAEGAPTETFADNVSRMNFDNWSEYATLQDGAEAIPEMAYPRVKAARQLPAKLRTRLHAAAKLHAELRAA